MEPSHCTWGSYCLFRRFSALAMMVLHESHRNARPGPRRRIFFRPQSLRHRRDAWASPALRRSPPAARAAGSLSSVGAGNCHCAVFAGILRGQNPLLRHFLGCYSYVHSSARRCPARFRRRRSSSTGMALGRRVNRRRSCSNFARRKSQRACRRQRQPRTAQQLGFESWRRCSSRVAFLDGGHSSRRHHHHRCRTRRALRLPALLSFSLRATRLPALASFLVFRVGARHIAPFVTRLMRYFIYCVSQSKNVLYQNWLFCGFSTQCPSSGKTTSFAGTPLPSSPLKNSSDCLYGTR